MAATDDSQIAVTARNTCTCTRQTNHICAKCATNPTHIPAPCGNTWRSTSRAPGGHSRLQRPARATSPPHHPQSCPRLQRTRAAAPYHQQRQQCTTRAVTARSRPISMNGTCKYFRKRHLETKDCFLKKPVTWTEKHTEAHAIFDQRNAWTKGAPLSSISLYFYSKTCLNACSVRLQAWIFVHTDFIKLKCNILFCKYHSLREFVKMWSLDIWKWR